MSVSQATKLLWFDRGASAFERTFPGEIKSVFGDNAPPMYVCPLCDAPYTRDAVANGTLTAEHVPPKSFGGRELLLTCRPCNNNAGTVLDAHARRKEDVAGAIRGDGRKPLRVRVKRGDHTINAQIRTEGATTLLDVAPSNNHPWLLESFRAAPITAGSKMNIEFRDAFAELGAKISWLRSAYLALFAAFGYAYWADPALEIVQKQIAKPKRRLIYSWTIELPSSYPWSEKRFLDIPKPQSLGVQFGRYVMLFPARYGDVTFYRRLEEDIRSRRGMPIMETTAQSYHWLNEPVFGYLKKSKGTDGGTS